jgi:hypothetical protein
MNKLFNYSSEELNMSTGIPGCIPPFKNLATKTSMYAIN